MSHNAKAILWSGLPPLAIFIPVVLSLAVPSEIQQPGTQPHEVTALDAVSLCDNCHGGYDPAVEPARNWRGSMMSHAARDPLFWAAMAIAEQDFAGAGDVCLRCHTPRGWLDGRATPADGSQLSSADVDGVECAICHHLVNPDDSEHIGVQNSPFLAHDEQTPKTGYYGSGMMVMWEGKERLGPYTTTVARHDTLQSRFHRSEAFCGTCHDVSNPAIGDLAPNNGAQVPLLPGTFSGTLGSAVATKAAFNNFPFAYGMVERTFSEHRASKWPSTRIGSYATLPAELRDGAIREAWESALATGQGGDYEDGSPRFFACQVCHMPPVTGKGAKQRNAPVRRDLPLHDMTGGNYWMPRVLQYMDGLGRLPFGSGLSALQRTALDEGADRARHQLETAARLYVSGDAVRVVNLTGHKLISGYPEGRRMWLRIAWRDALGNTIREDGAYGWITADINGVPTPVRTILDLAGTNTRIYEAKPGIGQDWAVQLLGLHPASLPLEYDRVTGATTHTLGQLAAQPAGTWLETFHLVLNNMMSTDTRIPPYGLSYDEARRRSILPVPATQYGGPGPGGTFEHWDDVGLSPPSDAVFAVVDLLYQPTSWEYVQFLSLANTKAATPLAPVGDDMLDAWLNTGMAEPHVMTTMIWCRLPGTGEDLRLSTQVNGTGDPDDCAKSAGEGDVISFRFASPSGTFVGSLGALLLQFYATGSPPLPLAYLPGIHLNTVHGQVVLPGLPAGGGGFQWRLPRGAAGATLRAQAVVLSPLAANGSYATSDAHDVMLR